MSNMTKAAQNVLSAAHSMWSGDELVAATLTLREELENTQLSNSEKFTIRRALAELFVTTHQFRSAESTLRGVDALCENMQECERVTASAHVSYLKARIHFERNEYGSALEKVDGAVNGFRAVCHKNALFNALLLKAKTLLKQGKGPEALAACEEARVLPLSNSSRFRLNDAQAVAYMYAGNLEGADRLALRCIDTIVKHIGKSNFDAFVNVVSVMYLLNGGNFDALTTSLHQLSETVEAPEYVSM